jgi:hypothetical protein
MYEVVIRKLGEEQTVLEERAFQGFDFIAAVSNKEGVLPIIPMDDGNIIHRVMMGMTLFVVSAVFPLMVQPIRALIQDVVNTIKTGEVRTRGGIVMPIGGSPKKRPLP